MRPYTENYEFICIFLFAYSWVAMFYTWIELQIWSFPPKIRLLLTKQFTRCDLYAQPNKDPSVSASNIEKHVFSTVKIEVLPTHTSHLQYAKPTLCLSWILLKNLRNTIIWRRPLLAVSSIWCHLSALLSRVTCQKQIYQKGEIRWQ